MGPVSADDKRAFSRIAVSGTISFDLPDGSTAVGALTDLSMRGAAFESALCPDRGTEGRLAIVFAGPTVIRGRGRVIRCHADVIALEIVELDLDSYHHMQNLIVYNSDDADRCQSEIDEHIGLKPR